MELPIQDQDSRIRSVTDRVSREAERILREQGLDVPPTRGNNTVTPVSPNRPGLGGLPDLLQDFRVAPPEPVEEIVNIPETPEPVVAGLGTRVGNELNRSQLTTRRDFRLSQLQEVLDNEDKGFRSVRGGGLVKGINPDITEDQRHSTEEDHLKIKRDLINEVVELTARANDIPTSEALQRFNDAEDLGGLFAAIGRNPSVLIESAAGSAVQSIPAMVSAGIGSIGGPVGVAIGSFVGSMGVEELSAFSQFLQEEGVDLSDPTALIEALEDDDRREALQTRARKKGLGTAATEGVFGFGLGKIVKASGLGKIGKEIAGTVTEAIGEGVGEAAGTAFSGGEVSLVDAARESLSSVPQSAGTAGLTIAGDIASTSEESVTPETVNDTITEAITDTQDVLPSPVEFGDGAADFRFEGASFGNPSVNLDEDGSPVSVTVTNDNGDRRTIADPDLAEAVLGRIEEVTSDEQGTETFEETGTGTVEAEITEVVATEEEEQGVTPREEIEVVDEVDTDTRTVVEREIDTLEEDFALTDQAEVSPDGSTVSIDGREFGLQEINRDENDAPVSVTVSDNERGETRTITDPELIGPIALQQQAFEAGSFTEVESTVDAFIAEALEANDDEVANQVFDQFDEISEATVTSVQDGVPVSSLDIQHTRDQILSGIQLAQQVGDPDVSRRLQTELFVLNRTLDNAELSEIDAITRQELTDNISEIDSQLNDLIGNDPVLESFVQEGLSETHEATLDRIQDGDLEGILPVDIVELKEAVDGLVVDAAGLPPEFSENLTPFLNLLQEEVNQVTEVIDAREASIQNRPVATPTIQAEDEVSDAIPDTTGTSTEDVISTDNIQTESEGQPESGEGNQQEPVTDEATPSVQEPVNARVEETPTGVQTRVEPSTGQTFVAPDPYPQPTVPDAAPAREAVQVAVDATVRAFALENRVNISVLDTSSMAGVVGLKPSDVSFVDASGRHVKSAGLFIPSDNRVVFFADALDGDDLQADVESVFVEEVVVHQGLRNLLGDDFLSTMSGYFDVMDRGLLRESIELYRDQLIDIDGEQVTATTNQIINGKASLNESSQALLVEEFFGRIAADDPASLKPSVRTFLQRVIDDLKLMFRKLGFNNVGTVEDEIRSLLVLSAESLRRDNGIVPDAVAVATSRLRVASERDQRRVTAINTFADTVTGPEQVELLNNIIPPRLGTILRRENIPVTPQQNLETLNLVRQRVNLNSQPGDVSPDVLYGSAAPFSPNVSAQAQDEIFNGSSQLNTFNGVAVTGGMNTPDRVEALHDQATGDTIRSRRDVVLSSRQPQPVNLNLTRSTFQPEGVDVAVLPIPTTSVPDGDAGLVANQQIRDVAARFPEKDGWTSVSVNRVEDLGDSSVLIEYRPAPYTFQNVADRRGITGDRSERKRRWTETLAGRVNDEVNSLSDTVRDNLEWFTNVRNILIKRYGHVGGLYADLIATSSSSLPTDITPEIATETLGRFISGEYDGLLSAYSPYLAYIEYDNVTTSLQNQFNLVSTKLEQLNEERAANVDQKRITELTEESIRVGGFDNVARALGNAVIASHNTAASETLMVDTEGNYNGPVIETPLGRGAEPLMRAMVNLYQVLGQERGQGTLMANTDGVLPDVWVSRALQRLSGDRRIPPVAEAGVSSPQRSSMESVLRSVENPSARDALFLKERELWVNEGLVSTSDFNPLIPYTPVLSSPVQSGRDTDVTGHTTTGDNQSTFVSVNNDTNPFTTAIDAITSAEDLGHDVVVVNQVTTESNSNTRAGLSVEFASPIPIESAERIADSSGLESVTITKAQGSDRLGLATGLTWTYLPELDPVNARKLQSSTPEFRDAERLKGFDMVDGVLDAVMESANIESVQITSLSPEFHDPLVIHKDNYEKERSRLTTLGNERDGITPENDIKTRKGGGWGLTFGQSVNASVSQDQGTNDSNNSSDIGRKTRSASTHEQAMTSILERMGYKNVSFGDREGVVARDISTIDAQLGITEVVGTDVEATREQLIEVASELGYDITFTVDEGAPVTNGSTPIVVRSTDLGSDVQPGVRVAADVLDVTKLLASKIAPINPNPILRTDAILNEQRRILETLLDDKIKARQFSRLYQYEMSKALGKSLGISESVVTGATKTQRGRTIKSLKEESQAMFEEARRYSQGGLDPATVRFNRRVGTNKYDRVLWYDEDTPRRTPRGITTLELGSHPEYAPENAASTQRGNTVATYRKIADLIPSGSTVLDYGGGLGAGTQVLRDNGFETTLYEPFPNESGRQVTEPDAGQLDGSDLQGEFDMVVNSFVLNVVPQDTRDYIVRSIANRVGPGGQAIFTVRGLVGDVDRQIKSGRNVDLGDGQVLITSTGAYQKGFTGPELVAYVQDVMGDGFEVGRVKVGSALAVRATRVAPTEVRFSRRFVKSPQDAADFARRAQDAIRGRNFPDGRPDLANPGRDEMSRLIVDQVDEIRNELNQPEIKRIKDIKPGVMSEVDADFDGVKQRLLDMSDAGLAPESMEDQLAIQEVVSRTLTQVNPNSDRELIEAGKLVHSYRNVRSEAGRVLATGYDPTLNPEARNNRYIIHALMTPPKKMRDQLDAANTSTEINAIWDRYKTRIRDIIETLASQGINIHALSDTDLKDLVKLRQIMNTIQGKDSSWGDRFYEYWINAILSAPTTHMANIVGNVGNTMWEFMVQRTFEASFNAVTGNNPDRTTFGELKSVVKALGGAFGPVFNTALRRANIAWAIEAPVLESEVGQEAFLRIDKMTKSIPGKTGRIMRIPTRLLLWTDEYLKSITFHLEAAALAHRNAKAAGYTGQALQSRIAHILSNPQSTEFVDVFQHAYGKARNLAFQDPIKSELLNALARKESNKNGTIDVVAKVIKWFVPFISTPTNILKQGIRRTPILGTIRVGVKAAGNIAYKMDPSRTHLRYDANDQFRDLSEQAAATALGLGMLALVGGQDDDDPWITGTEADFLTERGLQQMERRSVPALSVRIPGTDTYFSYQRVEPFSTTLALVVDGANALKQSIVNDQDIDRGLGQFVDTMRGLVKDKSFFQGIANLLELIGGGHNKVSNFTMNTASSFSPNVVRRFGSALDPVYRDNRVRGEGLEFWSQLIQRTGQKALPLPALSQAAKVDLWGRPSEKTPDALNSPFSNFMIDFLSPGRIASRDRVLPVDRMMKNYLLQNPNAEDQLPLPIAADDSFKWAGREVELDDESYNRYSTLAGQNAYRMIQHHPFNFDHPSKIEIEMVRNAYKTGKKMAQAQIVSEMLQAGTLDLTATTP